MIDKDTEKVLQLRREAQKTLDDADKEINSLLEGYMNKRSELLAQIDEIKEKQISPLESEVGALEAALISICKAGGIDKFSAQAHTIYEQEVQTFNPGSWDEIYAFIDNYKGDFDIHSILKKSLNSTGIKKFVKETAKCPDGIVMDVITKYAFKKK